MYLHQFTKIETSQAPSWPTGHSISEEGGEKMSLATVGTLTLWWACLLTGAGPLSVVVGILNTILFFQSGLLQVIIQRSQQDVHVSLVSLQHQFCHTSERLEERGSGKNKHIDMKQECSREFPAVFVHISNVTNSFFGEAPRYPPRRCYCWWRHWSRRTPSHSFQLTARSSWICLEISTAKVFHSFSQIPQQKLFHSKLFLHHTIPYHLALELNSTKCIEH